MANNLYVNFQVRMKVASDSAGEDVLFNHDNNLTRATIADGLPSIGMLDMAASETATTIPLGDITTVKIISITATENVTLLIDGTEEVPIQKAITGESAYALLMTSATSLTITCGTSAARVTYRLLGE